MKKITVEITKFGKTIIKDVEGFGTGCMDATQGLEARLGKVNESSRQTTENMYVPEIKNTTELEGE